MLALKPSPKKSTECTANILPCRIHLNGPAKVTKRYWSPNTEPDGSKTSYFRGRKLRGKVLKLPAGYQGVVAQSTDRTLPIVVSKPSFTAVDSDNEIEIQDGEEEPEPVKILENTATFDEITIWGHDQLPASDNTFTKGVEEWIAFAEAIHRPIEYSRGRQETLIRDSCAATGPTHTII